MFERISTTLVASPQQTEQKQITKLITNGQQHTTNNALSVTPATENLVKKSIEVNSHTSLLNSKDLIAACPILLYQLSASTSSERSGCINSKWIPLHKHVHNDEGAENRTLGTFFF